MRLVYQHMGSIRILEVINVGNHCPRVTVRRFKPIKRLKRIVSEQAWRSYLWYEFHRLRL